MSDRRVSLNTTDSFGFGMVVFAIALGWCGCNAIESHERLEMQRMKYEQETKTGGEYGQ